jgi:hypothetical protein
LLIPTKIKIAKIVKTDRATNAPRQEEKKAFQKFIFTELNEDQK